MAVRGGCRKLVNEIELRQQHHTRTLCLWRHRSMACDKSLHCVEAANKDMRQISSRERCAGE